MAKITFSKLGLTKNDAVNTFQFGENTIEVVKYLDLRLKSSMINAAVRYSVIKGVVDEVLVDAYLHMFILEHYTNITFTAKQRDNLLDTFDVLESNGFFDLIIGAMEPSEYEYIFSMAKRLTENINQYNRSVPSLAENAEEIINKALDKLAGQTN